MLMISRKPKVYGFANCLVMGFADAKFPGVQGYLNISLSFVCGTL